jgi:cell division protein FtsL
MDFLKKLQKLSLVKRKIIFWIAMIVIGLIFLSIFVFITINRLSNFQINNLKQDINFPSFETEDLSVPSLDIDWEQSINGEAWEEI